MIQANPREFLGPKVLITALILVCGFAAVLGEIVK
jgi:hypothetical protein